MNISADFFEPSATAWWLHSLILLLLAPFFGSFLGLVIDRLPRNQPILWSRSACDHCGHRLGLADLLPLVSWVALGRRCRYCGQALSARYPLVELAALATALWSLWAVSGWPAPERLAPGWLVWATCGLGWALLALALIDIDHFLLPDEITLPLIPAGLAVAWAGDPARVLPHAAGALAGFLLLWGLRWLYRRLRGREGLGLGDAKLLAAAGAWLSWEGLPSVILLAAAGGLLFQVLRWTAGRRPNGLDRLPFGPYLAAGLWLVWLYGPLQLSL